MSNVDTIDWIIRSIVVLGIPGLFAKYWHERAQKRKSPAESRVDEVKAVIEEKTSGDKVLGSSVASFESQIAAMQKAWAIEREAKDKTIEFQAHQLDAERTYSRSRDELIKELREQVDRLQRELGQVVDRLDMLQRTIPSEDK